MPETREPNLFSRRSRWRSKSSQASHGLGDSGLGVAANTNAWSALWVSQLVQLSQHVEQVALSEVDVSGHVCASGPARWCPDQSAEARLDLESHHCCGVCRPARTTVPAPRFAPVTQSRAQRRPQAAGPWRHPSTSRHPDSPYRCEPCRRSDQSGWPHSCPLSRRRTAFRTSTIDHSTGLSAR